MDNLNLPNNYHGSSDLPLSAFLLLKIGEEIYDLNDKRYIMSFKFSKKSFEMGEYTIGLSNVTDYGLEEKLLKALKDFEIVSFQYGHSEGIRSPWIMGNISNFTPTFQPDMSMTLAITGVTDVMVDTGFKKHYKVWSFSELVSKVIEDSDWNAGTIVESERFSEEREFTWVGQSPAKFLHSSVHSAIDTKGIPMVTYFINTTEEPKTMHFIPQNYNLGQLDRTYIINPSIHSPVLDFTPGYTGSALRQFPINSGYILDDFNEMGRVEGGQENRIGARGRVNRSSVSHDSIKNLVASRWFHSNVAGYTGNIRLIGDPDLQPTQFINIIPVTLNGSIHHTAGRYQVTSVEDDISGGNFTTMAEVFHMPVVAESFSYYDVE